MPKIGHRERVQAAAVHVAAVSTGLNARLGAAPAVVREHVDADHLVFLNADGTRSRICICCCDDCWPSEAGKNPPPCAYEGSV
jgi:hypothetical protein